MLTARIDSKPDVGITTLRAYSAILSKLSATPVDEAKVSHAPEDEPDPVDRFFN